PNLYRLREKRSQRLLLPAMLARELRQQSLLLLQQTPAAVVHFRKSTEAAATEPAVEREMPGLELVLVRAPVTTLEMLNSSGSVTLTLRSQNIQNERGEKVKKDKFCFASWLMKTEELSQSRLIIVPAARRWTELPQNLSSVGAFHPLVMERRK